MIALSPFKYSLIIYRKGFNYETLYCFCSAQGLVKADLYRADKKVRLLDLVFIE